NDGVCYFPVEMTRLIWLDCNPISRKSTFILLIVMTSPEKLRRLLIRMLDERLIPLAAQLENPILLMDPSNLARQQYQFTLHSVPSLDELQQSRSPLYLNQWDEQRVHAVRFPCLVAVVEGEIAWRIGITRSALDRNEIS